MHAPDFTVWIPFAAHAVPLGEPVIRGRGDAGGGRDVSRRFDGSLERRCNDHVARDLAEICRRGYGLASSGVGEAEAVEVGIHDVIRIVDFAMANEVESSEHGPRSLSPRESTTGGEVPSLDVRIC